MSATSDMSVARAGASATLLIDNRVLVAGGHDGTQDLATAEIYYPFAGTWEPTTDHAQRRRAAVMRRCCCRGTGAC